MTKILLLGSDISIATYLSKIPEICDLEYKVLTKPEDAEGWLHTICILLPGWSDGCKQEIVAALKRTNTVLVTLVQ